MGKSTLSPGQDVVIAKFVEHRRKEFPELKIDAKPDETNRSTKDIDAIAGHLAIEHTSIDTIEGQRGNNARFSDVLPDDEVLNGKFPYWASVLI